MVHQFYFKQSSMNSLFIRSSSSSFDMCLSCQNLGFFLYTLRCRSYPISRCSLSASYPCTFQINGAREPHHRHPDPGTLHALNYLPPHLRAQGFFYDDSQFPHVPVPALDFLHLVHFNLLLVRFFLAIRRCHYTSFRRLFPLMFSMPAMWRLDFDSLNFLADDIQLFDTILEPVIEEDFRTPLP
jgi:hypothetical protein